MRSLADEWGCDASNATWIVDRLRPRRQPGQVLPVSPLNFPTGVGANRGDPRVRRLSVEPFPHGDEKLPRRIDYSKLVPGAVNAVLGMEKYIQSCGLEHSLIELVKMRASYLNGCAYCVDMHSKDARAAGETEQRLYAIPVWRETPFFSERERAALAWTEAVTEIGRDGVSDTLYEAACAQFSDVELANLTMAVVTINAWNRLAIALGADVGSYQPRTQTAEVG